MARSVKISNDEMAVIEQEAKVSSRSIAGQVEHWCRIGRAIERSPNFSYQRVRSALSGLVSPDDLNAEEQEIYFDEFSNEMWQEPSAQDRAAFEDLLGNGPHVGLDDEDNLVYDSQS